MSETPAKTGRSSKKTTPSPEVLPDLSPPSPWLERIERFQSHYNRWGRDVLGVFLLVLGIITLFGLTGVSTGIFVTPWIHLLERWFGYGGYLLALVALALGPMILIRRFPIGRYLTLGRVLALEVLFFSSLALLATLSGQSLQRAEAGLDGGVIGWGLAELLRLLVPPPWSTLLLAAAIVACLWVLVRVNSMLRLLAVRLAEMASANVEALPHTDGDLAHPGRATVDLGSRDGDHDEPWDDRGELAPRPANLPSFDLLTEERSNEQDSAQAEAVGRLIINTLAEFGVPARVAGYRTGPTVTQYAVEPGYVERPGPDGEMARQKVRVSQISALSRDIARALSAERLRIEAPVPGQSYVGVEVPNSFTTVVRLRSILASDSFQRMDAPLGIALGKDVSGAPLVADLARMPHLLVAGTTGSGKSICIQAITTCLVMNNSPRELRLAMLDPKMVEMARFNGLPHLLGKVETKLDRMLAVLQWTISEMDHRYRLLEEARARDLDAYNRKMLRRKQDPLPRIVLLVDELADLMMSAPEQTEHALVRLAQMARATGIHLVVATQRPSTDVVTGLIKANFPARIAFTVASSVDSRVILDTNGAETLLGRGDMLFLNPEVGLPQRAQGALVTDSEVEQVIAHWQQVTAGESDQAEEAPWEGLMKVSEEDSDSLVKEAVQLVKRSQRASASYLQRQLRIGYPRAARLLDQLEEMGVVGPSQGGGRDRDVLVDRDDEDEDTEFLDEIG